MSSRMVLAGLGILALIGVGAWLGGVFEAPEDSPAESGTKAVGETGSGDTDTPTPNGGSPRALEPSRYTETPNTEAEASGAGEPSTGGGYRLTGRVVSGNGIVPGATVDLMQDNANMDGVHQLGKLHESTESDEKGMFLFEGLEPGERMIVRVTHDEYTMGKAFGIDAARASTLFQIIRVRAGHSIRGRVTHKDGRALEGVKVAAYDMQFQAYEPEDQLERSALTSTDGTWELKGLSKGIKRLVASKSGLASSIRSAFKVPADTDSIDFVMNDGFAIEGMVVEKGTGVSVGGARVIVRLLTGNSRGQPRIESVIADPEGKFLVYGLVSGNCEVSARGDAHLVSQRQVVQAGATGVVIEVPPAARLAGQVLAEGTREPVKEFTLLLTANPEVVISSRSHRLKVKNDEGRFEFAGVQTMPKLFVVVRAPGYAETVHGPLVVNEGDRIENITIAMGRGSSISGRVTDEAGAGIKGVRVTAVRKMAATGDPMFMLLGPMMEAHALRMHATTKEDGSYKIIGLRDGNWSLTATHRLYATERRITLTLGANDDRTAEPITLAKAGGIRGSIKAKDGTPDTRAQVRVVSISNPLTKWTRSTDGKGSFEILGVPAGDYRISVIQREGVVSFADLLGGVSTVSTVLAGQVLEIKL